LNVGSLSPAGCAAIRLPAHERDMARRMMRAYEAMGCEPSWTCAPYQAGHRPATGTDVAWGESNAVVFCNSVLGARTNRYGDFLDIACAIAAAHPITACIGRRIASPPCVIDVGGLSRPCAARMCSIRCSVPFSAAPPAARWRSSKACRAAPMRTG
jgi:predicted aconitase